MRITIDYQSSQGKKTGIGVFAENLVTRLREKRPDWEWNVCTNEHSRDLRTLDRIWWESMHVPRKAAKEKADIVYSPGFAPALFSNIKRVVTVHDIIGYLYPQLLPPIARIYWSKWLPFCIKRAECIVASSEATKRDLVNQLGLKAQSIRVVPLACSGQFFKLNMSESKHANAFSDIQKKFNLNHDYIVCVGTLEPRKNVPSLLEAFKKFKIEVQSDLQLVLAGKGGGQEGIIRKRIQELNLEADVCLTGYIHDAELNLLYNGALGYAMASSYEGFGLPVLEAMSCGKTGICSNVSSLPEVAGDTAFYINPHSVPDMAQGLKSLYLNRSERDAYEHKALERSGKFSWELVANSMIDVFDSIDTRG